MYVLDTNTLIYFFKGEGAVAGHLLSVPPREVGLPSIVLYELEVGISKSTSPEKRRTQLKEFTSAIQILPFGIEEASQAALIRVALEKRGVPIGPYDVLIAAVAINHNDILVTHNTKEFSRIQGLQLEDWYD
jgi:tRNA(fMet)-specific endonuclease VapC